MAAGDLPRPERTAADLGGRLCFGDESGQGLRPPRRIPAVRVTGASGKRVSHVCTGPASSTASSPRRTRPHTLSQPIDKARVRRAPKGRNRGDPGEMYVGVHTG